MGSTSSVFIDYDIDEIDIEKVFVSFYVGYIGNIYYGEGDNTYSRDAVKDLVKDFLYEAKKENTKLLVSYKSFTDSFTNQIRKEIIILENECQEKLTRNILSDHDEGTAIRLQILKNYIYGVFYYQGKLVAKISFD